MEYYPLNIGSEWIYQVDSTNFKSFGGDSSRDIFHRKVRYVKTRVDSEDRLLHEIDIYQKSITDTIWQYESTFWVYKDAFMVEENRNNIKLVSLVFPVKQNKAWDGNQLNSMERKAFVYKRVGKTFVDNLSTYTESFMVQRLDDSTFFDQQKEIEYYGKNVGLIYKEDINFTTKNDNKSGTKVIWRLLEYRN